MTDQLGTSSMKFNERGQWNSKMEFLLSCIGYSVGLGNIWRFPGLVFKNGGGAFLIPYFISVFVVGLPLYFLELSLGQFTRLGPSSIYGKLCPLFEGLGWAMTVAPFMVSLYYNMIVAWVLYYLVASFSYKLPWSDCSNDWNTIACHSKLLDKSCAATLNDTGALFYNKKCWNSTEVSALGINETVHAMIKTSAAEEYFNNQVLMVSDGISDLGSLSWKLVLCLFVAWFLVFLCLVRGIQSSGKVAYFTATFPYLLLTILLFRGVTLEGAGNGLYYYFVPDLSKLKDYKVWKDAASQVFYSLEPAFGGLITMASYNKFNNNCKKDALIVTLIDSFTSSFAGMAIFSIAGYMAFQLEKPVAEVTKSGLALAFIAYPEAISTLPFSQLWSFLFFVMMLTLGVGSAFVLTKVSVTSITDNFPQLRPYKGYVVAVICFICFLFGLPMCTEGGIYIFSLMDDYSAVYPCLIIALIELCVVCGFYGFKRFGKDISTMLGYPPNLYFKIMWTDLGPKFLLFILICSFIEYAPGGYGNYQFNTLDQSIGWVICSLTLISIPTFAIYHLIMNIINKKPWKKLITPVENEWGMQNVDNEELECVHL